MIIDDIEYEITNSTSCKVVGYEGDPAQVVIPEEVEINGKKYKVTCIGDSAFEWCSSLTSISLPSGITSLGDMAFEWCKSLTSIALPSGITSLGDSVFYGCENLTSIALPSGITSLGDKVFSGCENLTSIALPSGITSLGDRAFEWCKSLTSIALPSGITSLGDSVFYGCENLTSIALPSGITSLGDSAFCGCENLTSIALPSGITNIGEWAFSDCSSLTSIDIPDSVTNIGNGAFGACSSLTSIDLPNGITSIGNYAFESCENLTSIHIPDSVTSIGDEAFNECSSLTSIHIPESVKFIGKDVFASTDISHLKKEGTYLHFIGCNENDWEEFEDAISDDEDAISLDEWLQVNNRKKELNEFAVNAIIENVKENCPNGEFLEVTNIGTDCCELSLIFDDLTLWKSVFKTEEMQDNLGLIKEKAANYKALYEEATKAVTAVLTELKNETGGKYLKLTGLGTDCCELSLIYHGLTLWKSVFKTEELQDNLGLIKEKAANYEALYEEAPKD